MTEPIGGHMNECPGTGHLPRSMGEALPNGTATGLCISCMGFHPMYEVIPPSKPEWPREFRLASHEDPHLHKAAPAHPDDPENEQPCIHCRRTVKRVPGGHGPTWVHADTGAVVGFKEAADESCGPGGLCLIENGKVVRTDDGCPTHSKRPHKEAT